MLCSPEEDILLPVTLDIGSGRHRVRRLQAGSIATGLVTASGSVCPEGKLACFILCLLLGI